MTNPVFHLGGTWGWTPPSCPSQAEPGVLGGRWWLGPAPHKPFQTSQQPLHIFQPSDPGTVQGDLLWPGHSIPALPAQPLTPAQELPSLSTKFTLQDELLTRPAWESVGERDKM